MRNQGFALVISLGVMAFIVLILIGLLSMVSVETRGIDNTQALLRARTNAMYAADLALAQLQEKAGPDQRITAPATIHYPRKDSPGQGPLWDIFKEHATSLPMGPGNDAIVENWKTFLPENDGDDGSGAKRFEKDRDTFDEAIDNFWIGRNPHWIGVWESESRDADGDYDRDQAPTWLVSGLETDDPAETPPTPDTILGEPSADNDDVVALVGYGSSVPREAPSADEPGSHDGMDGRVTARVVKLGGKNGEPELGEYAYWVGDESLKANFASIDPYFEVENTSSREYRNRLQVPQRMGWERIRGFAEIFDSYATEEQQANMINNEAFALIATSGQIPLIDGERAEELTDAYRQNFHHVTGYSQGLFTDTARGGLMKDLSVYLETGAGLGDDEPIPDPTDYIGDPRMGIGNEGFPNQRVDGKFPNIPTWGELRGYYENEAASLGDGPVFVKENFFPIITQIRLFVGFTTSGNNVRMMVLPQIVLWNPYDAGLGEANYEIRLRFNPDFGEFRVASRYPPRAMDPNEPQVREFQLVASAQDAEGNTTINEIVDTWYYNELQNIGAEEWTDVTETLGGGDPILSPVSEATTNGSVRIPAYDVKVLPDDSDLILTIQTDFEPGESLMFSLNDDQQATKVADGLVVELENQFFEDNPAAAYIDVARILNPSISSTGTPIRRSIWARSMRFIPGTFNIQYYVNGDLIQRAERFGELSGDVASELSGLRAPIAIRDQPQQWRRLVDMAVMQVVGGENLNRHEYDLGRHPVSEPDGSDGGSPRIVAGAVMPPIFSLGEAYLHAARFRQSGTIEAMESASTTFRPFANYNIMAAQLLDRHPMIDAARHPADWANNNAGEGRWSTFKSVASSTSGNSSLPTVIDYFTGNHEVNTGVPPRLVVLDKGLNIGNNSHNWFEPESIRWNAGGNKVRAELRDGRMRGFSLLATTQEDPNASEQGHTEPNLVAPDVLAVRPVFRANSNLVSLGQFQGANLSEFLWQPAYPIGNSEASPYVDREKITGLASRPIWTYYEVDDDGIVKYNDDGNPVGSPRIWRETVPNNRFNHLVDVSYLLNDALWDKYFLSNIPQTTSVSMNNTEPLPNSRIKIKAETSIDESDVRDFDKAAAHLITDGAFNINSTSEEAWRALLTAFRDLELRTPDGTFSNPDETTPITRSLLPLAGKIGFTTTTEHNVPLDYGANTGGFNDYRQAMGGFRFLTDDMVDRLAERIVDEVRLRGPFFSLADFVNRRLDAPDGAGLPESAWTDARSDYVRGQASWISTDYDPLVGIHGLNGALQRAINVSGINGGVNYPNTVEHSLTAEEDLLYNIRNESMPATGPRWGRRNYRWVTFPSFRYYLDSENKAGYPVGENSNLMSHAPGYVTQGDLLTLLGPVLRPRGDTFVIRTFGSATNPATGERESEAWLEMIVQRTTQPVLDSDEDFEPDDPGAGLPDFGRRFEVVNVRWLTKDDV